MQEFYKKALLVFIFLVVADALLAAVLVHQSYLSLSLLPVQKAGLPWHYASYADVVTGGTSTIRVDEAGRERLRYDFRLTPAASYPFVSAELFMEDGKGKPGLVDWSMYSHVSFLAKCAPANSMALVISTFDDKVSRPGESQTYKSPGTYFSCSENGVPVLVDMNRLIIPEWWLLSMKLDLADQGYTLNKVSKIVFGTSANSPRNVDSRIEISALTLHGRDYRYIAALAFLLLGSLLGFGIWYVRVHSRTLIASLDSRLKKDLAMVAYRQLTLEPYKDKEKASVLRFIATNYTDAALDLDRVVNGTGANRNKVNEVLKTELGMTFTSYLNKLRLTEAARLLAEKRAATIAEIAYSVGYANVSYFNKLFKEEYGCTPKAFRSHATVPAASAGASPPVLSHPSA